MSSQRFGRHMEQAVCSLHIQIVGHSPHDAQIPFRRAISELTYVNPEVALAIGDDIANMKVAMHTVWFVHLLKEAQGLISSYSPP